MPEERQTVQLKSDYTELDSPGLRFQGARLVELLADRRLVKLSQMLLFFAIGLTAVGFLSLFPFTSPIADDYCRGFRSNRHIFDILVTDYRTWNGRWLSTLLQYLILPRLNFSWYGLLLALFAFAQVYSTKIFIRTVLRATNRLSWMLAVSGYIVWLTSGPTVGQNLYWLTGAIEYQASFILILLLFSLLCQDYKSRLTSILSVALSFLIPALNDLAGATLICALVTVCGVLFLERVSSRRVWLACLFAALSSLLIVVASPGNKIRKAQDFPTGWRATGIPPAGKSVIYARVGWALNPVLVSATALFVLLPSIKRLRPAWTQIRPTYLIVAPTLIVAAWLLLDFALAWLHSGDPPARVEVWNHMVWSILWFLTVFAWTRNRAEGQPTAAFLQTIFAVMLGVSIFFSQNTKDAMSDLAKRAPVWHAAQLRLLHTTENIAVVPTLPQTPKSFFDEPITSNPDYWINRCVAHYLHIESIAVHDAQKVK